MSDIISALREPTQCYDLHGRCYTEGTMEEAADYIEQLEAKLAATQHDIERHVQIASELATECETEREKVRVLREFVGSFMNAQKAHYGDATGTHIAMINVAHDAAEALATTASEGGDV